MDLITELNNKQAQAVETVNGPVLILAGAGSGKTKTIMHRIANIIQGGYAEPYNILALTFTNKAAAEMKERIRGFGIIGTDQLWMGTFHSIFSRILRQYAEKIGFTNNYTIYDESDSKNLINKILERYGASNLGMQSSDIKNIISNAKDKLILPDKFREYYSNPANCEILASIYRDYQRGLKENNAMDFDDLLLNTFILLKKNVDILEYLQDKFKYILVDEYQDTNKLQYEIVRLLSMKHKNICVCGDDDQSIYGWRGADIRNILEFEKDFPSAVSIKLEQNYRSTSTILQAANEVINNNQKRKGKNLWTDKGGGEKIQLIYTMRDLEEADTIAKEVISLHNNGLRYDDVAVLYRINAQSRILEEGLLRRSIPYQIIGGTRFYDRLEVKDVLAYLKFAANPKDGVSFVRAISAPKRGFGAASLEKLEEYMQFKGFNYLEAGMMAESIPTLSKSVKTKLFEFSLFIARLYDTSQKQGLHRAVEMAVKDSGYIEMLKIIKIENRESRLENLEELINASKEFEQTSEDTSLEAFLENASLITSAEMEGSSDGKVQLMTVHNSKGLEFETVFLAGFEENIFPLARSAQNEKDLEEERRLCYVAITRAKKKLYISHTQYRKLYGTGQYTQPSRFLFEIPKELIAEVKNVYNTQMQKQVYQKPNTSVMPKQLVTKQKKESNLASFVAGDKIAHPTWGEGTVVSVASSGSDYIVTAAFAGLGIKKFITGYANVKKI